MTGECIFALPDHNLGVVVFCDSATNKFRKSHNANHVTTFIRRGGTHHLSTQEIEEAHLAHD